MKEPTTAHVLEQIKNAGSVTSGMKYITETSAISDTMTFSDFFNNYLAQHPDLKLSTIINESQVSRTYAYEMINGKKHGSRDRIIALCFAAGMSIDEVNHALSFSAINPLYAKNNRDAFILLAFNTRKTIHNVIELNMMLEENHLKPLDLIS